MRRSLGTKGLAVLVLLAGAGIGLAQLFTNDVAARVNGDPIALADVKAVIDSRPTNVPLAKDQERAVRKAALDMLIDDLLMRQFLRQQFALPNSNDVERVVGELRDALKKQNKSLEEFLRDEKQTEQQLRADIITDLQWKGFLTTRYSENEAKGYFDAHRAFFEKVQVKASHILVKYAPTATQVEKDNLKARLENLRVMIQNNQLTFEEAARKYSDCISKERGGDLGYFTYKFMVVEPFARAAFATQVNDITAVVPTEFGLHLIKVTDRTAPDPADFGAMKDVVRKTMAQEQSLFRDILDRQRKGARIDILMN
ncbi:MAG: peptidylprolyl isomerase [Planctomycetota bacterium]